MPRKRRKHLSKVPLVANGILFSRDSEYIGASKWIEWVRRYCHQNFSGNNINTALETGRFPFKDIIGRYCEAPIGTALNRIFNIPLFIRVSGSIFSTFFMLLCISFSSSRIKHTFDLVRQ